MKRRQPLVAEDIEDAYADDRYEGYGYLGERSRNAHIAWMQVADAAIIDRANAVGWTRDQLHEFVLSKNGRWFGDETFHGYTANRATFNPQQFRSICDRAAARYIK